MKKLLLASFSLLLLASVTYTPAFTQDAKPVQEEAAPAAADAPAPAEAPAAAEAPKPKPALRRVRRNAQQPVDAQGRPVSTVPAAKRIALRKADCTPNNYKASTGIGVHGIYRSYAQYDPQLKSIEGRASFNECVKKCSDPLPEVYVQRAVFGLGLNWFGHTKQSCLDCHAKGH
jgi:hypothetical protein